MLTPKTLKTLEAVNRTSLEESFRDAVPENNRSRDFAIIKQKVGPLMVPFEQQYQD